MKNVEKLGLPPIVLNTLKTTTSTVTGGAVLRRDSGSLQLGRSGTERKS